MDGVHLKAAAPFYVLTWALGSKKDSGRWGRDPESRCGGEQEATTNVGGHRPLDLGKTELMQRQDITEGLTD